MKRPSASTSAATPSPVPGPRITCGPSDPNCSGPMRRSQPCGIRRQRQGLGLEIVEQQALREPRAARGFRAVHHPRRIGELERPPDNRPSAAGNHRAGARAELGNGGLDRLGQPRIITGAQVDDVAERPPGSLTSAKRTLVPPVSQTRAGKGKANSVIGFITQKDAIVVKQQKLRFISKALCQGLQLILN